MTTLAAALLLPLLASAQPEHVQPEPQLLPLDTYVAPIDVRGLWDASASPLEGPTLPAAKRRLTGGPDWSLDLEAAAVGLSYAAGPESRWGLSVAACDLGMDWGVQLRLGWSTSW